MDWITLIFVFIRTVSSRDRSVGIRWLPMGHTDGLEFGDQISCPAHGLPNVIISWHVGLSTPERRQRDCRNEEETGVGFRKWFIITQMEVCFLFLIAACCYSLEDFILHRLDLESMWNERLLSSAITQPNWSLKRNSTMFLWFLDWPKTKALSWRPVSRRLFLAKCHHSVHLFLYWHQCWHLEMVKNWPPSIKTLLRVFVTSSAWKTESMDLR